MFSFFWPALISTFRWRHTARPPALNPIRASAEVGCEGGGITAMPGIPMQISRQTYTVRNVRALSAASINIRTIVCCPIVTLTLMRYSHGRFLKDSVIVAHPEIASTEH